MTTTVPLNIDVKNYRSRCATNNKEPSCPGGISVDVNNIRTDVFEKGSIIGIDVTTDPYPLTALNFGRNIVNILYTGNTANNVTLSDAVLASLPEGRYFNIINTAGAGPFTLTTTADTIVSGGITNNSFTITHGGVDNVLLHTFQVTSTYPLVPPGPVTGSGKYLVKVA